MIKAQAKTILILANSIKKYPSRCVAGIELIPTGKDYVFGSWIRPIDPSQHEGALPASRTKINGLQVVPLQVVKMAFSGHANDRNHPEDWVLLPDSKWELAGQYPFSVLENLPNQEGDLWGAQSANSRRVVAGTAPCTLRLIKPKETVIVEAFQEFHAQKGKNVLKKFVTIQNGGFAHRFSITDPVFENKYGISPSKIKDGSPLTLELDSKGVAIVGSLTPPLNGYQYKIAAAIIES